jgi:hypothetical protein
MDRFEPAEVLAHDPVAMAVLDRVREILGADGPVTIRTTKSQVAFRRRRGFAWVWRPGQYLHGPTAPVVLSIALGRHDPSRRFKEVAHPTPRHWIHHLEVHDAAEIDAEVAGWLREACERA